jgi:phosphoserine phosphatase
MVNDSNSPAAAFFDLDRTLLDMNSSTLWARHELLGGGISIRQFVRVLSERCGSIANVVTNWFY